MSEIKVNKISPSSGTAFTLGDSGDTFTVPSGATFTNSGTATGFGGGKILQVRYATGSTTNQSTSSTTFVDVTDSDVAITCAATSSKVLILAHVPFYTPTGSSFGCLTILRGTTNLGDSSIGFSKFYTDNYLRSAWSVNYVDSPSSTSEITYKLQYLAQAGSASAFNISTNSDPMFVTVMEIGA